MDKEFTWNKVEPDESLNKVEPDESLQWKQGGSIEQDIESIKARIGELKDEREQLVAQLNDEYSDEKLAAQMMRAGDEGAMYKFLRGQQDNMKIQAADKAKEGKPTQEQFDKMSYMEQLDLFEKHPSVYVVRSSHINIFNTIFLR